MASTLTCGKCGAALPQGSTGQVTCAYCGTTSIVSAARSEPSSIVVHHHAGRSSGVGIAFVLVGGLAALIFMIAMVAVILAAAPIESEPVVTHSVTHTTHTTTTTTVMEPVVEIIPHPQSPTPAEADPTPTAESEPAVAETNAINGKDAIAARLAQLHDAGCDRVLVPPERYEGDLSFNGELSPGGSCVIVVAATAWPGLTLELAVQDPLGKSITTPPASTTLEWRHCPTVQGRHDMKLLMHGAGVYHLGGIDCPRKKFQALPSLEQMQAEKTKEGLRRLLGN